MLVLHDELISAMRGATCAVVHSVASVRDTDAADQRASNRRAFMATFEGKALAEVDPERRDSQSREQIQN